MSENTVNEAGNKGGSVTVALPKRKPPAIQLMTPKQRDRIIARMNGHLAVIAKHRDGLRDLQELMEDYHGWAEQCGQELEIAIEKMSEYV
jgi:hypothetical protein